jgi:alginate O-acetyltransferase complex protein AlgI
MGVNLQENFRWPYLAENISDFWRRWHISLSSWLRDYLYIPLGGSRKGLPRQMLNVLIVMFLGGLWHGADVKFIVWGLWIGVALAIYALYNHYVLKRQSPDKPAISLPHRIFNVLVTFHVVLVSWVFFRANSMADAMLAFQKLLTGGVESWQQVQRLNLSDLNVLIPLLLIVVAAHIIRGLRLDAPLIRRQTPFLIGVFWGVLILLFIVFQMNTSERFIYFQF